MRHNSIYCLSIETSKPCITGNYLRKVVKSSNYTVFFILLWRKISDDFFDHRLRYYEWIDKIFEFLLWKTGTQRTCIIIILVWMCNNHKVRDGQFVSLFDHIFRDKNWCGKRGMLNRWLIYQLQRFTFLTFHHQQIT